MNPEAVAKLAEVLSGDRPLAPGFEELYVALEAATGAVADLVTLAQALLPDELSRDAFVALAQLARMTQKVNPGPSELEPF